MKSVKEEVDVCSCEGHCGCDHHKYFLVRVFLGLVIISMVFWMGMKFGEVKQYMETAGFDGFRDRGMMMYGDTATFRALPVHATTVQVAPVATTTPKK